MTGMKIILPKCDRRMQFCAHELMNRGFIIGYPEDMKTGLFYDAVLLPPPSQRFACNESELFSRAVKCLKKNAAFFVGSGKDYFESIYGYEFEIIDYSSDRNYTHVNTQSSCEAALSLIISHTPFNLAGRDFLITGWGNLAKCLSKMISSLEGGIIICARKLKAREEALQNGYRAYDTANTDSLLNKADVIINTVPCRIFPEKPKSEISGKYFFELASEPFGYDENVYRELGATCIYAPSLPSEYSPETSGRAIGEAVAGMISERKRK